MPEAGLGILIEKFICGWCGPCKGCHGILDSQLWEKFEVRQMISIFGWCGPWKGSHWIMD